MDSIRRPVAAQNFKGNRKSFDLERERANQDETVTGAGILSKYLLALSRAELTLGPIEDIRLFCLQIVPARSGVDHFLKRLHAYAELPLALRQKWRLYRLLAARREQPVEVGGERQHRHGGGGNDGWLQASG